MGDMKTTRKRYTLEEIDRLVVKEADDPSKWDESVSVKPAAGVSIPLTDSMIRKVKAIARRKKIHRYQDWLVGVIRDRIRSEGPKPRKRAPH